LATLPWEQEGDALVGDTANDLSGYAVSLVGDGNTIHSHRISRNI
jgi:hypothetical protein